MGSTLCINDGPLSGESTNVSQLARVVPAEDERHALEVAALIAQDRNVRRFQSTLEIPVLFSVTKPSTEELPNVYLASHNITGMIRRLVFLRKPSHATNQELLKHTIGKLQSLRCDSVARILEVFEDYRSFGLIMEHCSGRTMYDRILQRPYFAEQESALLTKQVLQSLASLHAVRLAHGHPTPSSFLFHSDATHAALKLVDFGLELRVQEWDCAKNALWRRNTCLQLFDTCRYMFCAPEVVLAPTRGQPSESEGHCDTATEDSHVNGRLLDEAIDMHLEKHGTSRFQAADAWSVGAIAFLLLCGYPPFFAPCRHGVATRIDRGDYAFDLPFWSKISEEAKDFVSQCLCASPGDRLSVVDALEHPWIRGLADTSPSGCMLASFALNLWRFYRTSMIEAFAANTLAVSLSFVEMQELLAQCHKADPMGTGFFTATELRQLLAGLGYTEIAQAIGMCGSATARSPGESYIDYCALLDSVRVRRERLLEDDLWRCFCEFSGDSRGPNPATIADGRLPSEDFTAFLSHSHLHQALSRNGIENGAKLAESAREVLLSKEGCSRVDFNEVSCEIAARLPEWQMSIPQSNWRPRGGQRPDGHKLTVKPSVKPGRQQLEPPALVTTLV